MIKTIWSKFGTNDLLMGLEVGVGAFSLVEGGGSGITVGDGVVVELQATRKNKTVNIKTFRRWNIFPQIQSRHTTFFDNRTYKHLK
jgi:hypothetical protein